MFQRAEGAMTEEVLSWVSQMSSPHFPTLCFSSRELDECQRAQEQENMDENRSRAQLANIKAKHVRIPCWPLSCPSMALNEGQKQAKLWYSSVVPWWGAQTMFPVLEWASFVLCWPKVDLMRRHQR